MELPDLLKSKKFQAALVGLIVAIGGHLGFNLDGEMLLTILSPILAYIASQGLADALPGKEKVAMEAAARNYVQQQAQVQPVKAAVLPGKPIGAIFPPNMAKLLIEAGFPTVESIKAATDPELIKAGLTPPQVERVRETVE